MRFADEDIALFWSNPTLILPRRVPPQLRRTLYRKLQILDAAHVLNDLRVPPGNRLEKLKGTRAGQYSIRVNDQWRMSYTRLNCEANGDDFCDYHS